MMLTVRSGRGADRVIEVQPGLSLMQALRVHGIDGITADCGGASSCGTCRCRIAPDWLARLPAADEDERALLTLVDEQEPSVRLACRIALTPELNGLELDV
jgi:2Fe-2S ferredoxin